MQNRVIGAPQVNCNHSDLPSSAQEQSSRGAGYLIASSVRASAKHARPSAGTTCASSVVVPIGVIVAVAIVCVVVAVLGSAQRADEVALDTERQLFTRALTNHGERVLREIESVATSEVAIRSIRINFDPEWVQVYVGLRLQSFFDHDFVFVTDASDQLPLRLARPPQRRSELVQHDHARPHAAARSAARPRPCRKRRSWPPSRRRSCRCTARCACSAFSAAPPSSPPSRSPRPTTLPQFADAEAPVILSVKFIDERRAGRDRLAAATAQPAQGRRQAAARRRLRLRPHRSAGRLDRPLRLDAEAARRRDRPQRHPLHRDRARRASRCSPAWCCATCAAPPRPSRPARRGCATSPCTIRCAACRTASSSASGWRR